MRTLTILLVVTLASCGSNPTQGSGKEQSAISIKPAAYDLDPSTASKQEFEARGLRWPLKVSAGTLGCTAEARWIEIDGVQYGLNGTASEGRGYKPIEPIWLEDAKMAAELKAAGVPNDPPLRVNIGDMIEEAGKLC